MIARIKNNIKYIFTRFTFIASMIFGLISIMQMFVGWDILGVKEDTKCKIFIFVMLLVLCIIAALIWGIFFSNKKKVLAEDDVEIVVKYGDLFKEAFPQTRRKEKIVVIAVNCCFDTVISADLVKSDSVHGQFLQKFIKNDSDRLQLDSEIETSLQEFDIPYETLRCSDKRYGKLLLIS